MRLIRYLIEGEGGFKFNCADLSLEKARFYAEGEFNKVKKDLDNVIPDFDKNYKQLQQKLTKALDIPRIQMPVIEPEDMKKFHDDLVKGKVDIFRPYEGKKLKIVPPNWKPLPEKEGEKWITLGIKDGDPNDDKIRAKLESFAGKDLIPLQSQIWLEKLISNIVKYGPPKEGSPVLSTTIIVSKEGYILDGHHRFGQVMLADPSLKIKALRIPLDVKFLLKISRSYGAAIGREPKG